MKVFEYIIYFFIYAISGWCAEVVHAALKRGRFENRGFLNGYWCPIYGVGVVLVLLCLTPININVFVLFAASVVLTSVLEFAVGFVLEKLFKTKWWDYSGEHFNIKGYVCLKYSLLWGLACVVVVDLVHPMFASLVQKIPPLAQYIICGVLGAAFIVDLVFTLIQLIAHRKNYDALEKITEELRKPSNALGGVIASATLDLQQKIKELKTKIKNSRLYKAFPEQLRKSKRGTPDPLTDTTASTPDPSNETAATPDTTEETAKDNADKDTKED